MKKGDKVKFVNEKKHKGYPDFYPQVGTVGEIVECFDNGEIKVQWPKDSTSLSDKWYCDEEDVVLA